MHTGDVARPQSLFGDCLPQGDLVRTMKRLLASLVLCASLSASAQDDCELFNIQEIAAENLELQNTTLDTAIVQTDGSVQVQLSNGNAFQLILGCTDSDYTEYSVSANTDDGSCATLVVYGCLYAAASNFNTLANVDDGSCAFDDGAGDCATDIDGDGSTAVGDLLMLLGAFGLECQ